MSSGVFQTVGYLATYDTEVHPIRVQPETLAASINSVTNSAAATPITNQVSALVSRGRRSLGLVARTVTLRSPATGQPTGYKADSITRIPALTEAFYNEAIRGRTCTYLGVAFTVVGRSPEKAS